MKNSEDKCSQVLPPKVLQLLKSNCLKGKTGKIFENPSAMSTVNNLVVLKNLFDEIKPQRTLEIGLSFGASCLLLTNQHRAAGKSPHWQHTALDPYQLPVWDSVGLAQVEHEDLTGYLRFLPELSQLALPQLLRNGERFDLRQL